jgi:ABC-2 type transport system ATP-binding protein
MDELVKAPCLKITKLRKVFGEKIALQSFDLTLEAGEFYALLGANGAGKTTTMRMISGLLENDGGTINVFGHDISQTPQAAKQAMAWLPDEPLLYDKLTPLEYLEFVAGLWNIDNQKATKAAEDLLKRFDLWGVKDTRCEGFSRGMKQKTAIAGALLHDPKLLLMDEPFSGLDVAIARDLKDLLQEKCNQGAIIILTTHIMEIAQKLAQKIGIIHNGQLLAQGNMAQLQDFCQMPNASLEDIFLNLIDERK